MRKIILLILILSGVSFGQNNVAYLSFDGNDDYVKYADDATLGRMDGATDYTIEAWIYPMDGTVAEYDRVLQRYYSFAIVMYDGNNDGKVEDWYFETWDDGGSEHYFNTEGDSTLKLDAWNHIVVINDSAKDTLILYVNGVDVTTSGGYNSMALRASKSSDNLYIGSMKSSTPNNSFGGYIDEVRIKNVVEDIDTLHTSPTDLPYSSDANTAALFHFDEGSGTTTVNEASSTNATLNNGVVWETDVTDIPFPVELTSFTASKNGDVVILNWETATEVDNYGFAVERVSSRQAGTTPVKAWEEIGFVEGHGNSNVVNSYSFVDNSAKGDVSYRLKQIDMNGNFEYSDVVKVTANLAYKLLQNNPNPFNPTTQISFTLPEVAKVSITVYNALGQKVTELTDKEFAAGTHSVNFDASGLTSGIYFYRLNSPNYSATKKMLLVK